MRTAPKRIICGYLIHCWCNPLEELEYKTLLKEMCTGGGGRLCGSKIFFPFPVLLQCFSCFSFCLVNFLKMLALINCSRTMSACLFPHSLPLWSWTLNLWSLKPQLNSFFIISLGQGVLSQQYKKKLRLSISKIPAQYFDGKDNWFDRHKKTKWFSFFQKKY